MDIIISMCTSGLMIAPPIIIAALGAMFAERSGVINIAVEGIMTVGAFVAATVCVLLEPSMSSNAGWVAVIAAVVAGVIYSVLLAISAINFRADQTIAGTAVNLLSTGLCVYLCQVIFGQQRTIAFTTGISRIQSVPILGDIPIIGDILFKNVYPTFYIAIILTVIVWYVAFKTPLAYVFALVAKIRMPLHRLVLRSFACVGSECSYQELLPDWLALSSY